MTDAPQRTPVSETLPDAGVPVSRPESGAGRLLASAFTSAAAALLAMSVLVALSASPWSPQSGLELTTVNTLATVLALTTLALVAGSALLLHRLRAPFPRTRLRNASIVALRDAFCRLHAGLAAIAAAATVYGVTYAMLLGAVVGTRFETLSTGLAVITAMLCAIAVMLAYERINLMLREPARCVVRDVAGTAAIRWYGVTGLSFVVVACLAGDADTTARTLLSLPLITSAAWFGFGTALTRLPARSGAEPPIWIFVDETSWPLLHASAPTEELASCLKDLPLILVRSPCSLYVGEQFVAAVSVGLDDVLRPKDLAGLEEWLRLQLSPGLDWTSNPRRELYAEGELLLSAAQRCVEPGQIAILLSADRDVTERWRARVNTSRHIVTQGRTMLAWQNELNELRRGSAPLTTPASPDIGRRPRPQQLRMPDGPDPAPELPSSTDSDLVTRIARGDRQAETTFVRRHQREIELELKTRVTPDRVNDLIQLTFFVVIARMRDNEIQDPQRIGGILLETAITLANSDRRSYLRQRTDTDTDNHTDTRTENETYTGTDKDKDKDGEGGNNNGNNSDNENIEIIADPTPGPVDQHLQSSIDSDLAERVAQGDRQAETTFVRRYQRVLELVLQKRVPPDRVHDLIQETFIVVIARMRDKGIHDPKRIGAFLRQTAINLANSDRRKYVRLRTDTDTDTDTDNDNDSIELITGPTLGPVDSLEYDQLVLMIGQLIDELPMQRDRDLLQRYLLHHEEKHALCMQYGISVEHFDRVLYRARVQMKELLNKRRDTH